MIFVHKNTVTGLTTAAGIWATAGIGLAIGAGMYAVGAAAAVVIIAAQVLLHKNFRWLKNSRSKRLTVFDVDEADLQAYMINCLSEQGITVHNVDIKKADGLSTYVFGIEVPPSILEESIVSGIKYRCEITGNM